MTSKTRRLWLVLTAGVLVIAGVTAWLTLRAGAEEEEPPVLAVARAGDLIETASLSGTVEADTQVAIKSRASGEVTAVHVAVGDHVEAGQLLVSLDPVYEERSLARARASLSAAQSRLQQARAQLTVAEADVAEKESRRDVRRAAQERALVPAEEVRAAESVAEIARATVALRRADVDAAGSQIDLAKLDVADAQRRLDETVIRAPVAGTVLDLQAEKGDIVASGITNLAGGTSLLTVGDVSRLFVKGELDEADIGRVQAGFDAELRVDAYPGRTFSGRVERVGPLGREVSNIVTFDLDVLVTDPDARLLRPGMSVDLEVITTHVANTTLVPVAAVRSEGPRRFVLLADGVERNIETAGTDGVMVAVSAGLTAGDEVILSVRADRGHGTGGPSLFGRRPSTPAKKPAASGGGSS